jgi:trk system potassium uptake protein TrkA
MYLVVIGGGTIGYELTKALLNAGHEVLLIEKDSKKAMDEAERFGAAVLRGDGSEPSILEEAGVARADVLIATTGSDEDNLAACQLVRYRFNVGRTIAITNNPENDDLFHLLGVDMCVSSTKIILEEIEKDLPARTQLKMFPVRGDRELVVVEVPPGAGCVGKSLEDIQLPESTTVTTVVSRDGRLKSFDKELRIEVHDEVIALTQSDTAEALLVALTGPE